MKKNFLILLSTLIIITLLITGISIDFSLQHKNEDIKGINVTGSAKRDFVSDIIVWSATYSVNVGTTHFLALELFNNWQMSFVLIGIILVIALVGGVFLARREEND